MNKYPRTIYPESKKLHKLLVQKEELVLDGRKLSEEIDEKQAKMDEIDKQIQDIEKGVDTTELKEGAKELVERYNKVVKEFEAHKKKIYAKMKEAVPQNLIDDFENTKKEKEKLERDRKKIALKVRKWVDKIIPLGRKVMYPYLENEFEDYDTLRIEDNKIVATIFNHFEDWKIRFNERKAKSK